MSLHAFDILTWAAQGGAAAAAASPGAPQAQPSPLPIYFALGAIFLLYYFVMSKPQKAEARKRQEMLEAVAKGDQVVTTGGILGVVENVDAAKGVVVVSVAPKISLKFTKSAIASVTSKKDKGSGDEKSDEKA